MIYCLWGFSARMNGVPRRLGVTLNYLFLVIVIVDTEQNKQTVALIGGAAAAGGLGLIAFIALAVLFVKYRIARRFMNRNKVGDLYTTQDQQLSRKHAYIQEDDMIDKDDVL